MVAGCLMLGLVTTVAVAWGSAVWVVDLRTKAEARFAPKGTWRDQNELRREDGTLPSPRDAVKFWHQSMRGFGAKRTHFFAHLANENDHWEIGRRITLAAVWEQDLRAGVCDWLTERQLQNLALPGTPGPDPDAPNRFPEHFEWAQDARGWPFPALWCAWQSDTGPDPDRDRTVLTGISACKGGIELRLEPGKFRNGATARALPLRPFYPGLIANILIYAAAWYGAITLPSLLRNRLRRRRGLCPRCAYDLRGLPASSPCPECGAAAPASQA